jgi:hypothetical protein
MELESCCQRAEKLLPVSWHSAERFQVKPEDRGPVNPFYRKPDFPGVRGFDRAIRPFGQKPTQP